MKNAPQRVLAENLTGEYPAAVGEKTTKTLRQIDGHWVKDRGTGFYGFVSRFKLALDVFKGKADALYWFKQ